MWFHIERKLDDCVGINMVRVVDINDINCNEIERGNVELFEEMSWFQKHDKTPS